MSGKSSKFSAAVVIGGIVGVTYWGLAGDDKPESKQADWNNNAQMTNSANPPKKMVTPKDTLKL